MSMRRKLQQWTAPFLLRVLLACHNTILGYISLRLDPLRSGEGDHWIVEHEGKPVARLVDPWFDDMFWTGFRVVLLDEGAADLVADPKAWHECFEFRHLPSGALAPYAFPWGPGAPRDGFVSMRALCYVDPAHPLSWIRSGSA